MPAAILIVTAFALLAACITDLVTPLPRGVLIITAFVAVGAQVNYLGRRIEEALKGATQRAVRDVLAGSRVETALNRADDARADQENLPQRAAVTQLPLQRRQPR